MRETGNGTKKSRTLQELNLKDDFLFAKVMTDEEICKEVLEKILRINIAKIEILQSQKAINLALQNRGIRLDIYVEDEKGAFDPRSGYKPKGTLIKNLQRKVEQVKSNRGLEVEFMTFEEKLREEKKYSWEEGHKEGLEQGIEQGIQEGLRKKAESTARKLKAAGVDMKTIAESVGLTEAEIEAL